MSRFFATGSDSETESSSSEEEVQIRPTVTQRVIQWDETEEETRRVVKSQRDKRFDEMKDMIKTMRNHKKIKDMANILDDFEDLGKAYEKAKKIVEKEGIPRFYIRALVELEDFVIECWEDRDARKSMSKNNAKSLTILRQKLRRYLRDFEKPVADYRESPDEPGMIDSEDEAEESDESESSSEEEELVVPSKSKFAKTTEAGNEEEEDDLDIWGSDTETSSSGDEDVKYTGQLTADYFRKKAPTEIEVDKSKKEEKRAERKREAKDKVESGDEEGEWEHVKGGAHMIKEKPKLFPKDAEINHEAICKKLRELISGRGKKGTDRSEQMELLYDLRNISKENDLGDAVYIKVTFSIIASIYDYNPNIATSMKSEVWDKCLTTIEEMLDILIANEDTIICAEHVEYDAENFSGPPPLRIRGCPLTVVERMDEEYIKMLQACDAHSTEYVERLKDENRVCTIIDKVDRYLEGRGTSNELCRVYMRKISHLYYKFDHQAMIKLRENKQKEKDVEKIIPSFLSDTLTTDKTEDKPMESRVIMDKLCKYIYAKDTTDWIRTRAILCHIYHHALHDRWFEARDLMLMSHLQDTIQHSDIPTQIMYNRAMVQLGLCAFRQGMIKDAHSCLVDIQSSGRAKELLAQGLLLQRQHERSPEQEKIEKRRQMPYHMHINLELLECVYLVSAMLLEIPYMAAHEFDARRRMISKNFHHVLRMSERMTLVGPPESMREHVVAASKSMKVGDWKACQDYLINEKMNAKVWDLFFDAENVRNLIIRKVKEESLRTYLFSYSAVYDSLDLELLAAMFDLDRPVVHSIISKMIINEELMASLDEPTRTVVMHRTEPTRLQSLALQLSEKVSSLMDNNEKMAEMKQGGLYQRQGGQGYQDDQRRQGYKRDGQGGYSGGYRRDGQGGGSYRRDGGGYRRGGQRGNYRDHGISIWRIDMFLSSFAVL
ncbi:hypothetical protein LSH36_15g12053 [Paralvinella palmiformis]|uniref:Eukaryotic translation initiation factor 3 subunit C n=1 Tax=Paralvinella palmiformis TaxID=53620 RepID=A0AAD9NG02_9ANNE|nr:hypothetical protein LSH36_15g12053 [Paralvinella palmiformis]